MLKKGGAAGEEVAGKESDLSVGAADVLGSLGEAYC